MTSSTQRSLGSNLQFGLIFFSSSESASAGDLYRLVVESAKFADSHDFSSVWIPERHFTRDGWLYPNSAVLHAALARETKRIGLRAGSVVVPLHHPIRIVEDWAMVDNLSGGRVGLSFASGWHPNDFVFCPEKYANRREEMYRAIEIIRKLWEREPIALPSGDGKLATIKAYPDPVQRKLPIWITAAGNPATFAKAGEIGANLLTHMFNQNVDELVGKIELYRDALARHGHDPAQGQVTLMLHTFVTDDPAVIGTHVRDVFCDYLKSASYLFDAIAASRGQNVDRSLLSDRDIDAYVRFVFDRLVSEQRVLFGTPETCAQVVQRLRAVGVDEIACQLDFGIATDTVLASLPHLHRLKVLCAGEPSGRADERPAIGDKRDGPAPARMGNGRPQGPSVQLQTIQARCPEEVSGVDFYDRLQDLNVQFGTLFRGVERLWRRDGEALGHIRLADALEWNSDTYKIHPAFLDSCFQVLFAALPAGTTRDARNGLYLPVGVRSFHLHSRPGSEVFSHAVVRSADSSGDGGIEGDVCLLDMTGLVVAEARGLQLRRAQAAGRQQLDLDDCYYELAWELAENADRAPAPAERQPDADHVWLIFCDSHGVGQALGAILKDAGSTCLFVTTGSRFEVVDAQHFRAPPGSPEDIRHLIDIVSKTHKAASYRVIHLWSLDSCESDSATVEDLARAQVLGCGTALSLVHGLTRTDAEREYRLWLVTRGAQPLPGTENLLAVAQAPLWGFGRALAYEHPNLWGGLVDLDPRLPSGQSARALLQAVRTKDVEDQVAFRDGRRYAPRFVRKAVMAEPPSAIQLRGDASYLITGGLGDLGLVVARWMVERGARHIVLLTRTPLPPRLLWDKVEEGSRAARQIAAIVELEKQGTDVQIAAVDVADETQLTAFVRAFQDERRPPVRGLVHAAATTQPGIMLKLDGEALTAVARPKVQGGWLLHRLFEEAHLDFFVLFSAIPSLLGWLGQGAANYAAANAFLDALAHYRRAKGQAALSITWGPWREVGLADRTKGGLERLAMQGIGSVSPRQGQEALDRVLSLDSPQVAVVAVDWPRLSQAAPVVIESPLLAHFVRDAAAAPTREGRLTRERTEIRRRLQAAPNSSERRQLLIAYARESVARVLHIPAAKLDLDQGLNKVGLDSLMAIELRNRIEGDLGVQLPVVAFLQGPSINELAIQVLAQLDEVAAIDTKAKEAGGAKILARAPGSIARDEAQRLLAELDQLSDQHVDLLLQTMIADPMQKSGSRNAE